MLIALSIGTFVMLFSLGTAILMFTIATQLLSWLDETGRFGYARFPVFFDLTIASLWILLVLTCSVWIWAAIYLQLGLFEGLEPALYFSIASFTTVGYGDLVLEPGWRLLAGLTATHGLLNFGLFTAFLVEILKLPKRSKTN